MNKVNEEIICAGFGGQGIMVLGKLLATCGMEKGYNATWMPSYGAEVRGGTAHSMVKIGLEKIASPIVADADTAFIMSEPSFDKFENRIKKKGLLILNTSIIKRPPKRKDLNIIKARLTDEAIALGNVRVANMVAIGIYIAKKKLFDKKTLFSVIEKMAAARKDIIPINKKAVEKGIEIANSER